jgi:hypothetical protein
MASQSWGQLIATIPLAGTQYNTYTTAKSMLTSATATEAAAGFITLPPGFFQRGSLLQIDFLAAISNRVTGPDTFTIQVMVGAVIAFTTGAITLTTTAHTNIPLWGRISLSCRTVGNGTLATLMGIAHLTGQMIQQGGTAGADSATLTNTIIMPNTAPAVGTGFDSTVANTLDFFTAQSFSGAGNGFRLDEYRVVSWGNTAV